MRLYHWLLSLLFPPKCVLCGALLKNEELDLCRRCRVEAPWYPNRKEKLRFLDSFAAVWYYEGSVRKSLLHYKFYGARSYAGAYGRMLAMKLQEEYPEGFDCLTWIPVSRLRRFRRGYDQVKLLAQATGKELGMIPVPLIEKIRHNRPQSGVHGAAERRANVLGVYRVTAAAGSLSGKRVLMLDDILTTGATAGEAARVLLTAGAKEVHCAVIAAARK